MIKDFIHRNKYPFYKQPDAMDCGPVCLKMVAAYHGKKLSMQYLRKLCGIGKQGTTLLDLIDAADHLGFKTLAAELPFPKLGNVPLPCILHWQKEHYVVLYEVNDQYAYLGDPALNTKIKLKTADFLTAWTINKEKKTGRVLLLQPDQAFKNLKESCEHNTSLWSLLPYLKTHRKGWLPILYQIKN